MPYKRSKLEQAFAHHAELLGLPPWKEEYRFAAEALGRQWRFDFAWPGQRVAVECEGGTWARGRHTRGSGFEGDCAKYNAAAMLGWTVLRYTGTMLERDPAGTIEQVRQVLEGE